MSDKLSSSVGGRDAARLEIERTRERMSDTLDEIEGVLLRKKERFRDTMDVGARLREKPLVTAGVVLGAGFLLGFLTGGKDKEGEAERVAFQARAALWEERARRLLAIAREQEEDMDDLENSVLDDAASSAPTARWKYSAPTGYAFAVDDDEDLDDLDEDDPDDDYPHVYEDDAEEDGDEDEDDDDDAHGEPSRLSRLRADAAGRAGRAGGFISDFTQALLEGIRKQM